MLNYSIINMQKIIIQILALIFRLNMLKAVLTFLASFWEAVPC